MDYNVRVFNSSQGVALGATVGALAWVGILSIILVVFG